MRALARLFPHIVPTIRPPLEHAMFRAKFQWAIAQQERRGIPMDGVLLPRLRHHWQGMRLDLVTELDRPFGCFEIVNGVAHWRKQQFADYVRRQSHELAHPCGRQPRSRRIETFREMCGQVSAARAAAGAAHTRCRSCGSTISRSEATIATARRCGPTAPRPARNAPGASQFVFGPAKWLRFLITPPPGRALVHRDFCQQEVRIAAVLSGDSALLQACESGDVYLGIAQQLGFLPDSLNAAGAQGRAHAVQDRRARHSVRAWVLARWPSAPASRCSRPARSWRGCGRAFTGSRITPQSVLRSCRSAISRSARRSVGGCSARPA